MRRSPILPYLSFFAVLSLTALGSYSSYKYLDVETQARFEQQAAMIQNALHYRIESYLNLLIHTRAFLESRQNRDQGMVSREEYRHYADSVSLREHYPGLLGLGYIPQVSLQEEQEFLNAAREADPNYRMSPFKDPISGASGTRPPDSPHYPVLYIEPLQGVNLKALGFDMATEPTRRDAIERARDSGLPVVTGKVYLVQDSPTSSAPPDSPPLASSSSFLMIVPMYKPGLPIGAVAERQRAITGYVYAAFRARDIFESIFSQESVNPSHIDVEIYGGNEPTPGNLLFDLDNITGTRPVLYVRQIRDEVVPGSIWTSQVIAYRGFATTSARYTPWAVLGMGLLLSLLLLRYLLSNHQHAREQEAALARVTATTGRLEFLYHATAAIHSTSLKPEETLNRLTRLLIPKMADWTAAILMDDTGGPKLLSIHSAQGNHALEQRVHQGLNELLAARGEGASASNGAFFETPEFVSELQPRDYPRLASDPRAQSLLNQLQPSSYICVPLLSRGRALGLIAAVLTDARRHYSREDFAMIQELSSRAAVALENSFLYRSAQEAVESRDEFISVASHELKTPLTTLKLQAAILQRALRALTSGADPQAVSVQIHKNSEKSDRQVNRLVRLVDEMLDVSRMRKGRVRLERETFDLAKMVQEVAERYAENLSEAGCRMIIQAPGPVIGLWDHFRIEQILTNLLSNAAKYGAGQPVEIRVYAQGDQAVVEVHDLGIGIDAEHHDRIFQPFERAVSGRKISGLGIGLFIVRNLVEAHGGQIRVKSDIGQGSCFIVELPRQASQEQPEPKEEKAS